VTQKCQISKGVLSQVAKTTKIKRKSSMGRSSWGVTAIYIDINRWVHAFDRKFARY